MRSLHLSPVQGMVSGSKQNPTSEFPKKPVLSTAQSESSICYNAHTVYLVQCSKGQT